MSDGAQGERPERSESSAPARPPRPDIGSHRPPPSLGEPSPPSTMRASRTLWLLSFLAGFMVIGFAIFSQDQRSELLTDFIEEVAPDRADETLDSVAGIVFAANLILLGIVVVAQFLLVWALQRRHGSVRWILLALLPVHACVAVLVDAFIALGADGFYLRALLVVQLVLAGAATLVALLPSATAWFRREDEAPRHAG